MRRLVLSFASTVALLTLAQPASAEEGMWTFDAVPLARINAALGTDLDAAWLTQVQAGAVRLAGCSASLVSDQGLILTNQHCIRACIQANAAPGQDLLAQGVFARSREEELRCPGQVAEVLLEIEDVTARVTGAARGLTGAEYGRAIAAETARIEAEGCGGDQGLRCQVISLYRGGQYKLYRYRRYDDVRLVFAPEHQAVVFGGDPDNFNFPRYALDAAFLRAYEDDRPAQTPDHLIWSPRRVRDGEPVFVAGNPGSTSRLKTIDQLIVERDWMIPAQLRRLAELRGRVIRFAEESPENARMSRDALRSIENNLKRFTGMHRALADRDFFAGLEQQEAELRAAAQAQGLVEGDPWAEIAAADEASLALMDRYDWLEGGAGQGSVLYGYARALVRAAYEAERPADQRLAGFSDAQIAALGRTLGQARQIDLPLESLYLQFWLSKTREALGTDDPDVRRLLGRESPEALGARLIAETRLADPAYRAELFAGGRAAVEASDDPLIQLVLANDAAAREVREAWRSQVQAPIDRAGEQLARLRFALYGEALYPDATFSLRLSWGRIEGWSEGGREIAATTTVAGLWERATGAVPFNVAPVLASARDRLPGEVVYTLTTTNDIVGGNSGSPLLDAEGRVIGAVFDGNLASLGGAYGYDGAVNRAVAVSAEMVDLALRQVYGMEALAEELAGR